MCKKARGLPYYIVSKSNKEGWKQELENNCEPDFFLFVIDSKISFEYFESAPHYQNQLITRTIKQTIPSVLML